MMKRGFLPGAFALGRNPLVLMHFMIYYFTFKIFSRIYFAECSL